MVNECTSLPQEISNGLKDAFDEAEKKERRVFRLSNALSQDEAPIVNQFESEKHDILMGFDFNKNPEAVPAEDESKLRFLMQVVQNQATTSLAATHKDLTHDSETWIEFFQNYPLLFNFRSRVSKEYKETNFSLKVSFKNTSEFVQTFLGESTPAGIAMSLLGIIKSASGPVLDKQTEDKKMQYLVLSRAYDKAATLTIYKAQINMEVNEIKTLCGGTASANMNISYDEVVFEINNQLALALYPVLSQQAVDIAAQYLSTFFAQYAKEAFDNFQKYLKDLGS